MDSLVPAAVDEVLALAGTWLGWDGRPIRSDGDGEGALWTPHKALRRVSDHLVDHLAEIECRLAGRPTLPDHWHGRTVTTRADLAAFTQVDLDEARSRLTRLAACYEARLSTVAASQLDRRDGDAWSIRSVVEHVREVTYYARAVGDLTSM
jgi:hypothetical protein